MRTLKSELQRKKMFFDDTSTERAKEIQDVKRNISKPVIHKKLDLSKGPKNYVGYDEEVNKIIRLLYEKVLTFFEIYNDVYGTNIDDVKAKRLRNILFYIKLKTDGIISNKNRKWSAWGYFGTYQDLVEKYKHGSSVKNKKINKKEKRIEVPKEPKNEKIDGEFSLDKITAEEVCLSIGKVFVKVSLKDKNPTGVNIVVGEIDINIKVK